MKCMLLTGIGLFLLVSAVSAETMYVIDKMEITLRTGPGTDRKITAMVSSDQQLEVLQEGDDWSRVRLPSGKEGWVITRFLTSKMPNSIVLKQLQKEHAELVAKADALAAENSQLKQESKSLGQELTVNKQTLNKLSNSYETLKAESAEFLQLKGKYEKTVAELRETSQNANKMEDELTKLRLNQNIQWFITGAVVLLVGFIIGYATKRQRKRSSLL